MKRAKKPAKPKIKTTRRRPTRKAMKPMGQSQVRLRVNGVEYVRTTEVRKTLADFIREDIGLTGTHLGCEHGVCGACTILLGDQPVRSCLMFAVQAEGAEITTVEALGTPEALNPLQQAFMDHHALQCGFCTPGFLMSATVLLRENPRPTEAQVREYLSGHLCRCTGYQNIVEAVLAAAGAAPDTGGRRRET
jgi:aerobic-type carbon monoxide dehydrogenase small subunit (CoxS/CutS family)